MLCPEGSRWYRPKLPHCHTSACKTSAGMLAEGFKGSNCQRNPVSHGVNDIRPRFLNHWTSAERMKYLMESTWKWNPSHPLTSVRFTMESCQLGSHLIPSRNWCFFYAWCGKSSVFGSSKDMSSSGLSHVSRGWVLCSFITKGSFRSLDFKVFTCFYLNLSHISGCKKCGVPITTNML